MQDKVDILKRPVIPSEAVALYAALHRKHPVENMMALSDQQWENLLHFSDLAHLTLPLAKKRSLKLPEWVRSRLDSNLKDNQERFCRVKDTYLEADACLAKAGIEYVVIKGFTLAPEFVESPWLRQQSDIDMYCGSEAIAVAQAALVSAGYQPNTTVDFRRADHSPTLYRLGQWTWRGNAFDPEMPLSIELHHSLWNEKVTLLQHEDEIRGFFKRRVTRCIEGMKVPVLQDIDLLGHQSMHILRNLLVYDTVIHHVYEMAEFLDRKMHDEAFWSRWQSQHSEDLRAKEVIAFKLAARCFGCDMPDVAREVLDGLPRAQRSWLENFGHVPMELPFRENKDAVWLHWSLLSQSHRHLRKTIIRRTFFPHRLPDPDLEFVVLNDRKIRQTRGKSILRLLAYCCRRSIAYSRLHCRTIFHGMMWRLRGSGFTQAVVE